MIVLLGGGGFVGRATARALLHHGAHIHVLNRSGKAHHPDVPASRVDRSNPQEVILALDRLKAETVIDCIAFQSTDTLPLYQMIDQRGGDLTMLSSIDVYEAFGRVLGTENSPINQEPIRETSPLRSNLYPYAQIGGRQADYDKIPLEQAALSFRNARAQVVRLPMMFGPGDPRDRFAAVKQAIHENSPLTLPATDAAWTAPLLFVDDAGAGIARASLKPNPDNQVLLLGHQDHFTWQEHANRFANAAGASLTIELEGKAQPRQDLVIDAAVTADQIGWAPATCWEEAYLATAQSGT